ncbi:hypothetical protein Tco_1281535 [Tanacetum coccineum]
MMEKLFRLELELMLVTQSQNYQWEVQLHALVDGKKIIITESTVRRDLQLEDAKGVDCLPNSTIFEQLTLMGQNGVKGSANPTDPNHTPTLIQPSTSQPQKKQKPRKPKRKDTPDPSARGPGTTTSSLKQAMTVREGQKLEQKRVFRTQGDSKGLYQSFGLTAGKSSRDEENVGNDASRQGRINVIDADEDITLVNDQDDVDMFYVNTLTGDEVLAEQEVATKDMNLTVDEVTLAQALAALKSVKPKVKSNVIEEPSVPVSAAS